MASTEPDGLHDPLPRLLRRRLRLAVVDLVLSEQRRRFPVVLHAGVPGMPHASVEVDDEPTDPGLRTDVVAALLRRTASSAPGGAPPMVWLTRPGELTLQDADVRWLAAARAATTEAGLPLTMVVVTKRGWRDPRSGLARVWRRLRPRGPASSAGS